MKSTLVFWDTPENSKRGTIRGLLILPIYMILTVAWFYVTKNMVYKNHIDNVTTFRLLLSLFITGSLIVSIVAVQTPQSAEEALKYGALAGFAVYGICNFVLLAVSNKWGYTVAIIDTIWGIVSTMLLSYILYQIVQKWPNTFKTV